MRALIEKSLLWLLALSGVLLTSFSAQADVTLTFYSHDFGSNYPHAFVEMKGTLEDGTRIDEDLGFTAKSISPSILLGSVKGILKGVPEGYKETSNPHFQVVVPDKTYLDIKSFSQNWVAARKKSYNLNKRNCVHFIGEILEITGVQINRESRNFKKPRSFLEETLTLNPKLLPSAPLENTIKLDGKASSEPRISTPVKVD